MYCVTTMDAHAIVSRLFGAALFKGGSMLYDYGDRMLELMKERNITEKDLHRETGISAGTIKAFLTYNLPIDFIIFEKMLKAIDVSVVDFFSVDKPTSVF